MRRAIDPSTSALEHMHDPAQNAPIVLRLHATAIAWNKRLNPRPLPVAKPKCVEQHSSTRELHHAELTVTVALQAFDDSGELWSQAKKPSTFQRRRARRSERPSCVRARLRRCA